ncbi:MAG: hypothetical protein ACWGOX_06775 [Desulforhopalus sp.]
MNKKSLFHILVTDINHYVCELLQRELELEGYSVHSVKSAAAARQFILSSATLDLIILDPQLFYPYDRSFVAEISQYRDHSIHIIIHAYDDLLCCMAKEPGIYLVEKNAQSADSLKEVIGKCFLTGQQKTGETALSLVD